jgi:hypothetical protein
MRSNARNATSKRRGVPRTAIAPTTSSQNGSTPKPGIASTASPGNNNYGRPSTKKSSIAVAISATHLIGGSRATKVPMASLMAAMTKAMASRFRKIRAYLKMTSPRWSAAYLVPQRWWRSLPMSRASNSRGDRGHHALASSFACRTASMAAKNRPDRGHR